MQKTRQAEQTENVECKERHKTYEKIMVEQHVIWKTIRKGIKNK